MPNWCYNSLTISHDDPAMIKRIVEHSKAPLQELIPCPYDPETSDKWYDWRIENWGTKWDIELHSIYNYDDNTISCAFDSAWSPPIEAYNRLRELGFVITAMYKELGMMFCGMYDSEGEENIEASIDFDDSDWRDKLPEALSEYLEPDYQDHLEYINEHGKDAA